MSKKQLSPVRKAALTAAAAVKQMGVAFDHENGQHVATLYQLSDEGATTPLIRHTAYTEAMLTDNLLETLDRVEW